MQNLAVIVGAGASADVHNGSVPITSPNLRPPLARELFDARFWGFRQNYVGAEVLGAELGRFAANNEPTFDLEALLTGYANSSDPRTRLAFRYIPPYLRDVLSAASQAYVPSPTSYINLVKRVLEGGSHRVVFIVLNYDRLLEDALEKYDRSLRIQSLDGYIQNSQARTFKIHGSIDWGVPLPDAQDWDEAIRMLSGDPVEDSAIVFSRTNNVSREWNAAVNGQSRRLYPHLTAPVTDKTLVCPESHTAVLKEFLAECRKFLIVGCSGLDQDLLRLMSDHVPGACRVCYVNFGREATESVRQRFESVVKQFVVTGPASTAVAMSDVGFTRYLDTQELEQLLSLVF